MNIEDLTKRVASAFGENTVGATIRASLFAGLLGASPGADAFGVGHSVFALCPPGSILALCAEVHQQITEVALTDLRFTTPSGLQIGFSEQALYQIKDGNTFTDLFQSDLARHFDNNFLAQGTLLLIHGKDQILSRLQIASPTVAHAALTRNLLGTYLHTIQDFFSHSTWVNGTPSGQSLPRFGFEHIGGPGIGSPCRMPPPGPSLWSTPPYTGELQDSGTGVPLASGYVVPSGIVANVPSSQDANDLQAARAPRGQCAHGFIETGIHKDWVGRPFHEQARFWAEVATTQFVHEIFVALTSNPDAVCMLMTNDVCPASGVVTIDFNAIDASAGPVSGAPVRNYLASFGVTSPNSFSSTPVVFEATRINSVSPTRNVFGGGDGLEPATLTLEFNPPVNNLSFVRTGVTGVNGIFAAWTATAYDASNRELTSVGEPRQVVQQRSSVTFTLNVENISRLVFSAFTGNAGTNIPWLTNIGFSRESPD